MTLRVPGRLLIAFLFLCLLPAAVAGQEEAEQQELPQDTEQQGKQQAPACQAPNRKLSHWSGHPVPTMP